MAFERLCSRQRRGKLTRKAKKYLFDNGLDECEFSYDVLSRKQVG